MVGLYDDMYHREPAVAAVCAYGVPCKPGVLFRTNVTRSACTSTRFNKQQINSFCIVLIQREISL